jgi:NAD(P)-dependent dehydrogenase (short-subunit alcohol dehydrogenase family)
MDVQTFIKIINFYGRFTPSYTKIGYFGRGLFLRHYEKSYTGERWLITGASGGIGRAMVVAAAKAGAQVVAVARSELKLKALINDLPTDVKNNVSYEVADMSLQSDTEALRDRLIGGGAFNVLLNNVGVLFPDLTLTNEGREATFVTNILSHYILTEGLVANDKIVSGGAIINMTSGGMYNMPIGIRKLNVLDAAKYNGKVVYAAQKRGQAVLTGYWNAKYRDLGIQSYVMHPGWTKTPGVKSALPVFYKVQNWLLRTPYQGGETALWLASMRPPSNDDPDGGVWLDRCLRPAHMYDFTKTPQCTVDEFVAFLDAEVARGSAI